MSTNFDEEIQIRNSHSAKWDAMVPACGVEAEDALAMWVADMDFKPPQSVLDALQAELDRGVFGYYTGDQTLRASICNWLKEKHNWEIQPEWLSFSHGVIAGLAIVLEAFTDPGDGVIIFTPVYHAFSRKIEAKGRTVVESHLELRDGGYHMNLEALKSQLTGAEKMVIFCSPHNPGGKIWSAEEIRELVDFCNENNLLLVSDEIHMDLTFPGKQHLPTAVAAPSSTPRLIVLSAASKGFNIAGAETSFIVVEDAGLRAKVMAAQASFGGSPNRFGMIMMEAAFKGGSDWSDDVRAYLYNNFKTFRDGVNAIPGLSVMEMDSTYLVWVDFSGTGMTRQEFTDRVAQDARIAVNLGPTFGTGGESYLRFNIATRTALVEEAVGRLAEAFADLQ